MTETLLPTILGLSLLLQLSSATAAVVLSVRTGFYKPWILIAAAVILMSVRRMISLLDVLGGGTIPASALGAELTALVISVFMLTGILLFGPALRTIRQRNEQELQAREMMVRETHHHIKNDLQLLLNVVTLQKGFGKSEAEHDILRDLESRIHSISLLHEQLYRSEAGELSFSEYVRKLAASIEANYNMHGVRLEFELCDLPVNTKSLVYAGIVLNEALTNCFKHAFHEHSPSPGILIRSRQDGGDGLLHIEDNGTGIPQALIEHASDHSYGMSLLHSVGENPGWSIEIDGRSGTSITARFPLEASVTA